jgi:hypothetical protein
MKRPAVITFFCVLTYLSVVFTFPQVFSPSVKKMGVFIPALYGLLVASQFISTVGIWYFKQWGVQLYLLTFFSRTLFFILSDQIGFLFYLGLAISLTFIIILIRFYPKMNSNL